MQDNTAGIPGVWDGILALVTIAKAMYEYRGTCRKFRGYDVDGDKIHFTMNAIAWEDMDLVILIHWYNEPRRIPF